MPDETPAPPAPGPAGETPAPTAQPVQEPPPEGETPEMRHLRNEAEKYERLARKFEKELEGYRTAERERQQADMTELERTKAALAAVEAKAAESEAQLLRQRVALELGVPADALEFLTGSDEETIRAQASRLTGLIGARPTAAGTVTNPPGNQIPSIDEQIAAAQSRGDWQTSIRLKRQQAGLDRGSGG